MAPDVRQILSDNNVEAVVTFAMPPEISACLMMHVENDTWVAAVGGNEGILPGRSEEDIMRFAREVCGQQSVPGYTGIACTDCTTLYRAITFRT